MGLPPRRMINPRPTRFVSGKAIECRGRPRRYDVDPSSGWREVARDEELPTYVLIKVIIVLLYVASRRARSIVIYHKKTQHTAAQYMWRWAFHLDIWSTHDQPASCRARPLNVEDGLEDTMWSHRLGGDRLLATRGCSRMFWSKWSSYYTRISSLQYVCIILLCAVFFYGNDTTYTTRCDVD